MIERLIICTDDIYLFDLLNKKLVKSIKMKCEFSDAKTFFHNKEYDIINSPTTFMEEFNVMPMDLDCQIIKTDNKHELTDYVVTSPNFKIPSRFTRLQMGLKQLEIPLKKVQEYFRNSNVIYAIHSEYSFAYFENTDEKMIDEIFFLLNNILNDEKE